MTMSTIVLSDRIYMSLTDYKKSKLVLITTRIISIEICSEIVDTPHKLSVVIRQSHCMNN